MAAFRDNSAPFVPGRPDEPARIPVEENSGELRRPGAGRTGRRQSPMKPKPRRARWAATAWVVKAQVHAGGRGKAGGVKLARELDEVRAAAAAHARASGWSRSRPARPDCRSSASTSRPARDRARAVPEPHAQSRARAHRRGRLEPPAAWTSKQVAHDTPEKILSVTVHPAAGLQPFQCRQLGFGLGLKGDQLAQFQAILMALYRLYLDERDASLIEINPLIVTREGKLVALDCKLDIEANALFRQGDMAALRDPGAGRSDRAHRQRARPELRLARRQHRLHGQRRGPGDGDHGPDQAARRRAGEFPRRRRRRDRERVTAAFRADSVQSEGARDPGQHLRRHRALRPDRRRHHQRGARTSACNVPVVVRLEGTNAEAARAKLAGRRGWRSSPRPI